MIVKLYRNTGFDSLNIPDSFKMLETNFTPYREYNNVNVIQDLYLAYVDLPISLGEIEQIDYCTLEDTNTNTKRAYIVQSFESTAPNTFRLILILDAFTSINGFIPESGNQILSCNANRLSVSIAEDDDKLFTLPEPFEPAERCTENIVPLYNIQLPEEALPSYSGYENEVKLIESVTAPPQTGIDAETSEQYIKSELGKPNDDESMYVLVIPRPRKLVSTVLQIRRPNGQIKNMELGVRWWLGTSKYYPEDLIKGFRAADRDNDMTNYWIIPVAYIEGSPDNGESSMEYSSLTPDSEGERYGGIGRIREVNLDSDTQLPMPKFYNKKARYSQSWSLTVVGMTSGNSLVKQPYEVLTPDYKPSNDNGEFHYKILADIRPNGTPIFTWKYNNGVDVGTTMIESVKGSTWQKISLVAEGATGSQREAIDRVKREIGRLQWSHALSAIGTGIQTTGVAMGGLTYAAGSTALVNVQKSLGEVSLSDAFVSNYNTRLRTTTGGIGSAGVLGNQMVGSAVAYARAYGSLVDERQALTRQAINASTTIRMYDSDFNRDLGLNTFGLIVSHYSDQDAYNFDTFLTQYGYNVGNKRITTDDLYSRPDFNFVRINDIQMLLGSGNLQLAELVKQQLKLGVRLWHKKPNPAALSAGGNR